MASGRLLPPHRSCRFVASQRDECGMSEMTLAGPFQELDLRAPPNTGFSHRQSFIFAAVKPAVPSEKSKRGQDTPISKPPVRV